MIAGEINNKVDPLWGAFWRALASSPLSTIEKITVPLFAKWNDKHRSARVAKINLRTEFVGIA